MPTKRYSSGRKRKQVDVFEQGWDSSAGHHPGRDEDGYYLVEDVICRKRTKGGAWKFKIRWKGWEPQYDTWESYADLNEHTQHIIQERFTNRKGRKFEPECTEEQKKAVQEHIKQTREIMLAKHHAGEEDSYLGDDESVASSKKIGFHDRDYDPEEKSYLHELDSESYLDGLVSVGPSLVTPEYNHTPIQTPPHGGKMVQSFCQGKIVKPAHQSNQNLVTPEHHKTMHRPMQTPCGGKMMQGFSRGKNVQPWNYHPQKTMLQCLHESEEDVSSDDSCSEDENTTKSMSPNSAHKHLPEFERAKRMTVEDLVRQLVSELKERPKVSIPKSMGRNILSQIWMEGEDDTDNDLDNVSSGYITQDDRDCKTAPFHTIDNEDVDTTAPLDFKNISSDATIGTFLP